MPLLKPLDIDPVVFQDFEARISLDSFCRLLEALSALSSRETFGIDYANFFQTGGTGVLGQGIAAAPTVEAAFRFMTTNMTMLVDHRIHEVTYESDTVTIEWSYSPLIISNEQCTSFLVRLMVNALSALTGGRQTYGSFAFQHQAPKNLKQFGKAFPGKLLFDQEVNCAVIMIDLFGEENPGSNPPLFDLMEQTCSRAIKELQSNKPLTLSLQEDILENLSSGGLSIEAAARRHGLSIRTLQRRLKDHDVTYETLIDDARASLVEALLQDERKTMAQIADEVGYSDQSAFSRAVVKRFNLTPTQLRISLLNDRQLH